MNAHCEGSLSNTLERKKMSHVRSNIDQIQQRLEQKLIESKSTFKDLQRVTKERHRLGKENMRLLHRVAFLEEHTKELKLGMKQVAKEFFLGVVK